MNTLGRARNCRFIRQAMIPMRDGVRLATTIFLPEKEGRYPTVLQRRPYNRLDGFAGWEDWVQNGYAFIVQDTRGRYDSEGEFVPFLQEINDTPDTIGWIRQQDWSNGKVGMMGPSYLAVVQTIAVANPSGPMPDAIVPTFMSGNPWVRGYYSAGPLSLFLAFWWLCFDVGSKTNNSGLLQIYDLDELLKRLPLNTLDVSCGAGESPVWREWLKHPTDDEYWLQYGFQRRHHNFTMPSLFVGGWYDYYPAVTLDAWKKIPNAKVIIGPWGHHHGLAPTRDGHRAVDFGVDNNFDCHAIYRKWYDRVFKDVGPDYPPIQIFVMGRNQWRSENEWPLARTKFINFYLHADRQLNQTIPRDEKPDPYDYDPANPVPTRGGNHSIGPWNDFYKDYVWCGPCDQRPTEARPDVLTYTTAPLEQDFEVTGPVTLKLWASTSARDTDFVARLCDVYPDGRSINITEGVVRARYRDGGVRPGEVLEYTISLQDTSNVFLKGHSIRLHITSSNFPLWDRNLNTGADQNHTTEMVVAHQEIRHDSRSPSHLILPVIP